MADINLKCPKLRDLIRQKLNLQRFDEPFQTLIEEAFLRASYVLDLTPEELMEDLNNFNNSIYYISWGNCNGAKNVMGVVYPGERRMEFNTDFWQNIMNTYSPNIYCTKFFESFSHEVLHGMQNVYDNIGNIYNRAGGWNKQLNNRSHAIYEICTQGTAAKMANDRFFYQFKESEILTGDGYSNEIFAIPLIASTFGVSEQEVLKYGMREREKLVGVLDRNIGNKEKTAELLNKIEEQLDFLHSIWFPDSNQKKFIKMSDKEKQKNSSQIIINLVDICQEALAHRIMNTSLDFDKDVAIKFKYDQRKIEATLRHEIERFNWTFKDDYITLQRRFEYTSDAVYIKRAIEVFNEIGKDKTGRYLRIAPELIAAVKRNDFDFCMRMGIIQKDELTYTLVENANEFNLKRIHEDYNDFRRWDNKTIFEAIYPGLNIPFSSFKKSSLKGWTDIYTPQGLQKIQDLRYVLNNQKYKYGIESKEYLLSFFDTQEYDMENFYSNFTRQNNARDVFRRSFRTIYDKEFLAKYIAEIFVNTNFEPNGTLKEVSTDEEKRIQSLLHPTIIKYGRSQLVYAIEKIIVNDEYDGVSTNNARTQLCMIGRKRIFDIVSQPMLDNLLNQRRIIQEKGNALRNSIYQTNKKYPNSIVQRLIEIVKTYKTTGEINANLFTSAGRGEFRKYFSGNSRRNIEDLLGLLINSYADIECVNRYDRLSGIVVQNGKDYFRENIIKSILDNDYSGFFSKQEAEYIKNMPLETLLSIISSAYIQKSIKIGQIEENGIGQQYIVQPSDIKPIAYKRRFSLFSKTTDGLIKNKDLTFDHSTYEHNEE